MTVAIGLDVGGTKMAAGLVDRRGQVLLRSEIPTRVAEGGGRVLERALAQAQRLHDHAAARNWSLVGVGVSVCELVDRQGAITSAYTLPWQATPVQQIFARQIAPAVVEADVRAVSYTHLDVYKRQTHWLPGGNGQMLKPHCK